MSVTVHNILMSLVHGFYLPTASSFLKRERFALNKCIDKVKKQQHHQQQLQLVLITTSSTITTLDYDYSKENQQSSC